MPDIRPSASLGAQLEWDGAFGPVPFTALLRGRQNLDTGQGMQADLRLSAGIFRDGRFAAGVFTQATWASAKATNSLYGITDAQAPSARLPAFSAGSGLLAASIGILWSVDLAPRWVVVGSLERRHLQGDAAHSPLSERSTSHYLSAGVAYRF